MSCLGRLLICWAFVGACASPASQPVSAPVSRTEPSWQPFEMAMLERARSENKLVLLSVQAGWCHWCHVMNATTYRDPEVLALLREHFVVMRVEQDQRPDLAERYAAWGWPATALLSPSATPLVTLRGHQPARSFANLLRELVAERDAGGPMRARSTASTQPERASDLTEARDLARAQLDRYYDAAHGGWGSPQKYPWAAPVEHALLRAAMYGESARLAQAQQTLHGHAQLIDPIAGGMYQYSLRGVWTAPHFEKIAAIQAGAMETFAAGYRATGERAFLRAGEQVAAYVLGTLRSPSGAFYASQDADLGHVGERGHMKGDAYYALSAEARRAAGVPAVDQHVFSNLNGKLIRGLCAMYEASGDRRFLDAALAALESVRRTHLRGQAFIHDARGVSDVFYLSDQVEMAAALLAVSEAAASPELERAADSLVRWCLAHLSSSSGALFAATPRADAVGVFSVPTEPYADNALLARVLLRLARMQDDSDLAERAHRILLALSDRTRMATQGRAIGEYLLALEYALGPTMMVTIVGPADDARTTELAAAARSTYLPQAFTHQAAPGASVYPYPGEPAAYFCSANACSAPVTDPAALPVALRAFVAAE